MSNSVHLSSTVTVEKYRKLESGRNTDALADFIYERLSERYVKPVSTGERNGFAIMACACLLIETLESFYRGWKSTQGVRPKDIIFDRFFNRTGGFTQFGGLASSFYKCVRCGILHQGETTGGWRITRKRLAPVFDPQTRTIQATKFLSRVDTTLRDYSRTLKRSHWNDPLWRKFCRKMNKIIENCEANP